MLTFVLHLILLVIIFVQKKKYINPAVLKLKLILESFLSHFHFLFLTKRPGPSVSNYA